MMQWAENLQGKEKEKPLEPESLPTERRLPWFIISLTVVSWAVFLYSLYENNCPSTTRPDRCLLYGALGRLSFQPFQENSQLGPAVYTLVELGGVEWDFRKKQSKKWNILSSIFFHTGLVSLISDTISLLYMGMKLEQKFGVVKIGSLYFLSSIGGSLWASLKFEGSVYVGGSSGVCGLTGGAFAEFFINLSMHEEKFKTFLSLCLGLAFNFTVKLWPRADVSANIGGLYLGFLFGFLVLIRHQPESYEYQHSGFDPQLFLMRYSRYQRLLLAIASISTIIQFMYSLVNYILR